MIHPYKLIKYARASLILVILLVTGCIDDKLPQASETDAIVVADIAFTVSKEAHPTTRVSAAVVQEEGQAYRGIEMRHIVPFAIAPAQDVVTASDMPKAFQVYGNGEKLVASREYYYYDNCTLMPGVNAFLCYGRAPQASSDKHVNGSLVETFPTDMATKDIRFSLEAITSNDVHPTATALDNYMTAIANAEGNNVKWKNTSNATLRVMYMNFLNKTELEGGGNPLPGSAANVKTYTQALKRALNDLTLTDETDLAICTAINTAIDKIGRAHV